MVMRRGVRWAPVKAAPLSEDEMEALGMLIVENSVAELRRELEAVKASAEDGVDQGLIDGVEIALSWVMKRTRRPSEALRDLCGVGGGA